VSDGCHSLRVVLVAPPGAGKGTQGYRLADAYQVLHLSAGEILRAEVARSSAMGELVSHALKKGELVPDTVVSTAVFERLAVAGSSFVLDGFPRTLNQAVSLDKWTDSVGLPVQAAIELQVPYAELVARLTKRAAGSSRPDDTKEVIEHRLDAHAGDTGHVVAYYRTHGLLIAVDGTGEIDLVTQRIRAELDTILARRGG
jgi:adenylate kinase